MVRTWWGAVAQKSWGPRADAVTAAGAPSRAFRAGVPSSENPFSPQPAMVVMMPSASTWRMTQDLLSAK